MNATTRLHRVTALALMTTVALSLQFANLAAFRAENARKNAKLESDRESSLRRNALEEWKRTRPPDPGSAASRPESQSASPASHGEFADGIEEATLKLQVVSLRSTAGIGIVALLMVLLVRRPVEASIRLRAVAAFSSASAVAAVAAMFTGLLVEGVSASRGFPVFLLCPPALILVVIGIMLDVSRLPARAGKEAATPCPDDITA